LTIGSPLPVVRVREVIKRLALGRATMSGLERVCKDRGLSGYTKARLVKALVFPVATYGCETWTLGKAMKNKISAFEMWCWRRMLWIPWTAKRSNTSILGEIKEKMSLVHKVLKHKLTYFGHVVRSDGLEKTFMFGRGRPRRRWMDEVMETTGLLKLKEAARDRVGWRDVVRVVTRGHLRPDGTR